MLKSAYSPILFLFVWYVIASCNHYINGSRWGFVIVFLKQFCQSSNTLHVPANCDFCLPSQILLYTFPLDRLFKCSKYLCEFIGKLKNEFFLTYLQIVMRNVTAYIQDLAFQKTLSKLYDVPVGFVPLPLF